MGTVCWRGQGAGSAGGVALRRPANGVARGTLESVEKMLECKCGEPAL